MGTRPVPGESEKKAMSTLSPIRRKIAIALCAWTLLPGLAAAPHGDGLEKLGTVERAHLDLAEWRYGDAPIVISVPHGGGLRPKNCANRTWGKTVRDGFTAEIGQLLSDALFEETGKRPHLVLCHLHRSKLDANREIEEAAQGDPTAELVWSDYHDFIESASEAVVERYGTGLYVDLHGQSHAEGWIEWGYTLSSRELNNEELTGKSSLAHLVENSDKTADEIIRGPTSLGGLSESMGYKSVPGPIHPSPRDGHYFSGGYSTARHGSKLGGTMDGVQLELPRALRMKDKARRRVSRDIASVIVSFMNEHYDIDWVESE